jgi:hypothetical protein
MLPNELTFTSFVTVSPGDPLTLPAAQKGNEASGFQVIPGGIGGFGPFVEWWNEYFEPVPDFGALPPLYRGDEYIEFSVPENQTMSIESVDVRIAVGGSGAEALDHLRLTLISPDGTPSELNHYRVASAGNPQIFQWETLTDVHPVIGEFGTTDPNTSLIYTFNTNRSWGERSDNRIVFDPVTGEPVIDQTGLLSGTLEDPGLPGQALQQGWRLVIENWDTNDSFTLADVEIAWHGSPIAANSERIQGFVGVDNNRDDQFNFSRMIQTFTDLDNDPTTFRLGEVVNEIDLTQESFAGNITVTARRVSDNAIVDQFVTGHDGNFYFDLVPGDYIISIEDPQGREAKGDTVTAAGFERHYKSEWRITPEHFKVWNHSSANPAEVLVDASGTPQPWLDANGQQQVYGMSGINFLLDPGDVAPNQAVFTGTVYADTNGDGAFNGTDVVLPGAGVFGDLNRNGSFDSGEQLVTADANGQYNLVVPLTSQAVMNVGVVPPAQWTVTNPSSGLHSVFASPGTVQNNLNFFLKPALDNAGGGGADQPGTLLGSVFIDVNGNGSRDTIEQGAAGVIVYLDANNNGVAEATETKVTANQFGAYAFTGVAPGQHVIRVLAEGTFQQTLPANGAPRVVNLIGSSVISNLTFGIRDAAIYDFGDLPAIYAATTLAENGARHFKGPYWLGGRVDSELDGVASPDASADDLGGQPDEDGVSLVTFVPGATSALTVTASRFNGYLQGWIDWNNDGDFNDANERVVTNRLLNEGANEVLINVPAGIAASQVFARFRYGEFGINSPFGAALTGEVEDYRFNVIPPASPVVGLAADFDQDGDVDGGDFLRWQRNVGRTSGATQAQGSADGDGDVDRFDLDEWQQDFGSAASGVTTSSAALMAGSSDAADLALSAQSPLAASSFDVGTFEFAAALRGNGSAPLSVTGGEATDDGSPARAAYRPALSTGLGEAPAALRSRELADATDRDQALDALFGVEERAQDDGELGFGDDGTGSDEAFAILADELVLAR